MKAVAISATQQTEQDRRIAEVIGRERVGLRRFIARHVPDPGDAEDILQEVFYELVVAYRLMKPIRQAGAWLFRVAQNRVADWFRGARPVPLEESAVDDSLSLADLLPSPDRGPETEYARAVLLRELEDALAELPEEQREIFLAHEVEGRSFASMAAETGLSINTLLARKRYAVLRLRKRLQDIYDELEQE